MPSPVFAEAVQPVTALPVGRDNAIASVAARMTVTNCAGGAGRDPDDAIALGRGTGNKRPCQGGNPTAGVGVGVTIDHGQIIHSTCRDARSCVAER